MTTIRAGKIKYLAGDYWCGEWRDCELTLLSDANLKIAYNGNLGKIEAGSFREVVPLKSVPNCFVLKSTEQEKPLFSRGPIFMADSEEECRQWMVSISEVILKNLSKKHQHPLPQEYVVKERGTCSSCSYEYKIRNCFYDCEFCEYVVCNTCYNNCYNLQQQVPQVTSVTHPHPLIHSKFILNNPISTSKPECSRCQVMCTDQHYVCTQCPGYFECSTCAYELLHNTETTRAKQMQLDLGNLDHVIHSTLPNTYLVDTVGKRSPSSMSVVSQQHWDLSRIDDEPVNSAYFEVTFVKISGTVGVGIGNQIFTQNKMLGQQQNSYGYLFDGKVYVDTLFTGSLEFPTINAGDTIGVGILLDAFNLRRLYFTKNGKMLGCLPGSVPRSMDCFPGVSFSQQGAEFVVNMSGPFKFDVENKIVDYRHDKQDRLKTLPEELIWEIILGASRSYPIQKTTPINAKPMRCHDVALQCRLVSKMFKKIADDNAVWRKLFRWCFPNAYHDAKVKSWKQLYKARYLATAGQNPSNVHPIENCEFELECPGLWEKLKRSAKSNIKHCDKCNKDVFKVSDPGMFKQHAEMGRCFSLVPPETIDFRLIESGMAPPEPRHIPGLQREISGQQLLSSLQNYMV